MPRSLKKPRRSVALGEDAPKRAVPPRRRALVVKRAAAASEGLATPPAPAEGWAFFQQGLLTAEQKRQLILAHATARQARRLPRGWLYIMGVAVSCLVVVAGWWLTVGNLIRTEVMTASRPGFQDELREQLSLVEEAYPLQRPDFGEVKEVLNAAATSQAAAR